MSPALPAAATLLQLMWLASPALPVGGFSYSEGLEAAVDSGVVTSESEASTWLLDQLQLGLSRNELPVVARAVAAWQAGDGAGIEALNSWVMATRESSELRQQTEQMGRSLAAWLKNRPADDRLARLAGLQPAPTYPLAFALAASQAGADPHAAMLAYAFGWAENMVQAAIKSVPLGQSSGQRILARLAGAIPAAADRAMALDDGTRQSFTPMLAILSAQHETQYSRLFRS
jgi:urease accessory protein